MLQCALDERTPLNAAQIVGEAPLKAWGRTAFLEPISRVWR